MDDLLARLKADAQARPLLATPARDVALRERKLLINFLCSSAGGPLMYVGAI
jgi:hemoglobin